MDDILNALAKSIKTNSAYIAERIRGGASDNLVDQLVLINAGRLHSLQIIGFAAEADTLAIAERDAIFIARKDRADFLEMREAINSIPSVGGAA